MALGRAEMLGLTSSPQQEVKLPHNEAILNGLI